MRRSSVIFAYLVLFEGSATVTRPINRLQELMVPQQPFKYEDTQPSVEIRLSPPRHPLPEVSADIEVLDRTRRLSEELQTTKLLKAYDEELVRSRKLITALIKDAFQVFDDPAVIPPPQSLFQIPTYRQRPGRIWVNVEGSTPVDGTVIKSIESLEKKNNREEAIMFKAAIGDMHEVTRFTLQQLHESLDSVMRAVIVPNTASRYSSFIALNAGEQRCQELKGILGDHLRCDFDRPKPNVTSRHEISLFADEHLYPTVESLVRDMLTRREVDENLFRARTIALMARLAQEQSKITAELLYAAVGAIRVQYSQVIRGMNMTRNEQILYDHQHPLFRKSGTGR
jgi:hypothetical protein